MATYAAFKHVEIYNVGSGKKRVLKPPGGSSTDIFGTTDLQSTPRSIKNHMKSNIFAAPAPLNKAAMAPAGEVVRRVPVDSHNRLFGTPERDNTAKKSQQGSIVSLGNGDERDAPWKQTNGNGYSKRHINGGSNIEDNISFDSVSTTASTRDIRAPKNAFINLKTSNNPTYYSKINLCINDDSIKHTEHSTITDKMNDCLVDVSVVDGFKDTPAMKTARRNPVTGNGILCENNKSKKMINNKFNRKDRNPVTGEGFKQASEINSQVPSLGHQVVNKNRIPPGGFSSGLW
ncbi:unnamed protein product [Diamesa hyperborea]